MSLNKQNNNPLTLCRGLLFSGDLHNYIGFRLHNVTRFSPTLVSPGNRDQLKPKMQSTSISMNAYRFKNGDFKMKPALGIVGNYKQEVKSFYVK